MKKRKLFWIVLVFCLAAGAFWKINGFQTVRNDAENNPGLEKAADAVKEIFNTEPADVRELREQDVAETDSGHQEYYFRQLGDEEKRIYREMLAGIRRRDREFYLSSGEDDLIDKVYHALLKDHPELFWIHNRVPVYKTTYAGADYCLFSPGYTYTDQEIAEIEQKIDQAYQDVASLTAAVSDPYEQVKTVYTYIIDHTEYASSEDDQNIAGVFWKNQAVCAGYARAVHYLLEKLGIPCIYVEGSAAGSSEGHAWNIVRLDDQYYYVDATNGDQPEFLEGDAAELAEHKTTLYDYLCPFPEEYEMTYTPSPEFSVPECTSYDKNFYVLNQGCFDSYDREQIMDYCRMRLDNGAAVVRFKFSGQEVYDAALRDLLEENNVRYAAEYYMQLYGISSVEYHYGLLQDMKTVYLMF